jgi:hypothetical protein
MNIERFCECDKCHRLGNSVHLADPKDGQFDKDREDMVAGVCPYEGCDGVCYYLEENDNKRAKLGFSLAKQMCDGLNPICPQPFVEAFIIGLQCQHRTLQQSYGRMMQDVIRAYAKLDKNWYDGRNEAFVKFCQDAMQVVDRNYLPMI